MTSARTNLVMTVIGFVVSMLFIVLLCTKLIRSRIRLRASRRIMRRHIAAASAATFTLNSVRFSLFLYFLNLIQQIYFKYYYALPILSVFGYSI